MFKARESSTVIYIRIGVMVLSFIVLLFVMYKLNTGSIDPGAYIFPHHDVHSDKFNWCPTRVTKIIDQSHTDVVYIEQKGMSWWQKKPYEMQLSNTPVEKWLTDYCVVETSKDFDKTSNIERTGQFEVTYVSGKKLILEKMGEDIFLMDGQILRSTQLARGLEELRKLR